MVRAIKIGQRLEGRLGAYLVTTQVARNVWTALRSNSQSSKVVIKTARPERLETEIEVLRHVQGRPHIRQMVDEIKDPPSIVLQYLDDNLLAVCTEKAIEGPDLKFVTKRVLQALRVLHDDGLTHSGVEASTLSNDGPLRFADVQLADLRDLRQFDPEDYLKIGEFGAHMGAPIFRSPEAMINLRWGPSTDIWSFGATLMSLLWGTNFHIFKPSVKDATHDDENYLFHILIRQIAIFGPLPLSYLSLIAEEDDSRLETLGIAVQFIEENHRAMPFKLIKDKCLTEEHREFILKIMKLDPRDRPTAADLLNDKWFEGVE